MEPGSSLPHSQVPATRPYPEPAIQSISTTSHILKIHLNVILLWIWNLQFMLLQGSNMMMMIRAHRSCNIILNSVRQHNHFITQGNYKATCFDYRLVIIRTILSIVSQDATQTLGSHRVYIHGIHQIRSFVCKGVTCKLCLQQWDT